MTEKRFIFNGLHIRDTLNIIPPIMTHNEEQRDKFLNGLNKLSDENKELKTFKDKIFALIDARIEIYKRKPFMAPVSAPMSVNFDEDTDRLARLSELEQLKKELSE